MADNFLFYIINFIIFNNEFEKQYLKISIKMFVCKILYYGSGYIYIYIIYAILFKSKDLYNFKIRRFTRTLAFSEKLNYFVRQM